MIACGLWPTRTGLVATVVDEAGSVQEVFNTGIDDDSICDLLIRMQGFHGLDIELVVPESFERGDAIIRISAAHGIVVWFVPDGMAQAIRFVAGLATGPPRRIAAMLARLPLVSTLRKQLRRCVQLELPL